MYNFYVEYIDGSVYRVSGLTKRQAVIRYNKVGKSAWAYEVARYGWSEVRATE